MADRKIEAVLGKRPTAAGWEYLIKYEFDDLPYWQNCSDVSGFSKRQVEKVISVGTWKCLVKWPGSDAEMWIEPEHVGLTFEEANRLFTKNNKTDGTSDSVQNTVDKADEAPNDDQSTIEMQKTEMHPARGESNKGTQCVKCTKLAHASERFELQPQKVPISYIEKILGHRKQPGSEFEYKVRWRGCSHLYDCWVPARWFYYVDEILINYYKTHPKNLLICSRCESGKFKMQDGEQSSAIVEGGSMQEIPRIQKALKRTKHFGSGLNLHKYLKACYTNVCRKCGSIS